MKNQKKTQFKEPVAKIIRLVLFIAVILLINLFINSMAIPATEFSRWQNHDIKTKDYDVLVLGPSDALTSFDTAVAKDVLNKNVFNYGSPQTRYIGGQVYATFLNSMAYQTPDTVVCILSDYDCIFDKEQEKKESFSAVAYCHSAYYMSNVYAKAQTFFRTSINDSALEKIFLWKAIWIDLKGKPNIKRWTRNVVQRFSKEYRTYNLEWRNENDRSHPLYIDGFFPEYYKESWVNVIPTLVEKEWDGIIPDYSGKELEGGDLEKINMYCKEHGIRLILMPGLTNIHDLKSQLPDEVERWTYLETLASQYGVEYYNPNLIKLDYLNLENTDFSDERHLSNEGASKFTEIICEVYDEAENGNDTAKYFYNDYNEWLEAVK